MGSKVEVQSANQSANQSARLSPPWYIYVAEIKALFEGDPEVTVEYDEEKYEIKIFVNNQKKADALTQLLPMAVPFGSVILKVTVVPPDNAKVIDIELFETAFKGNAAFKSVRKASTPFSFNYVVFAPRVVQFYSDNLGSPYGLTTTLYQNIAKEIFGEVKGIYFTTDKKERADLELV